MYSFIYRYTYIVMYTYLDPPFSVPRVNLLRVSTSSVGGCWKKTQKNMIRNHVYNGFPCRRGDEISMILSPFHIGCWPDIVLTSHNSCQFYCWWPKFGQPLEYGEYPRSDHCFIHHQYYWADLLAHQKIARHCPTQTIQSFKCIAFSHAWTSVTWYQRPSTAWLAWLLDFLRVKV